MFQDFLGITHVLSACEECQELVEKMYSFRETCKRNNRLLKEYIGVLLLRGGTVGNISIEMVDVMRSGGAIVANESAAQFEDVGEESGRVDYENDPEVEIKVENEQSFEEDPLQGCGFEAVVCDPVDVKVETPDFGTVPYVPPVQVPFLDYIVAPNPGSQPNPPPTGPIKQPVPRPHKCETCGRCFRNLYRLKSHMFTHSDEKPHKCEQCGKSFCYLRSLKDHLFLHTGEKKHKCGVCGRAFNFLSTYKQHMLLHTGEKPFKCPYCDKSFHQSSNLRSHVFTHTGEKPYKCDICNKPFARLNNMQMHRATHTNQPD